MSGQSLQPTKYWQNGHPILQSPYPKSFSTLFLNSIALLGTMAQSGVSDSFFHSAKHAFHAPARDLIRFSFFSTIMYNTSYSRA